MLVANNLYWSDEAARVVMGVEQRQLIVAVRRISGVVDVQRVGGGRGGEGTAEEIDHRRGQACHLNVDGAFSRRLMIGCEQSARPLS